MDVVLLGVEGWGRVVPFATAIEEVAQEEGRGRQERVLDGVPVTPHKLVGVVDSRLKGEAATGVGVRVDYLGIGDEDHAMGDCARGLDFCDSINLILGKEVRSAAAVEDDEDEGKSYPFLPIIPEAVLDRRLKHFPLPPPHQQHPHGPHQIANAHSIPHAPALSRSSPALMGSPVFVSVAIVAVTERRQGTLEDGRFCVRHVRRVGVRPVAV